MSKFYTACLLACMALPAPVRADSDDDAQRVGRKIEAFTLKDHRGKSHSLADFEDGDLVVVAFLGTECPLAKLYAPRLAKLSASYGPQGVRFLGINANSQDSITEIAAYVRTHEVPFPILKDLGNRVADQFQAVRTPEVFVLDSQRVVRYWGRIDDQYGIGVIRDEPLRQDLEIALAELLTGQAVSVPATKSVGCHIGRVKTPSSDSDVTYCDQISRILQNRCVECHRPGEIAPFSLLDYDEVVGWAEMIAEVVQQNRMPPWHANPAYGHFANDRHLTDAEKDTIDRWVEAGAPMGEASDLPAPRQFVSGSQLPREPDLILPITERPFVVAAEGEVRYQYFTVDPGFKEDRWIQAAELVPGNRAVVHHILAFAVPPGKTIRDIGGGVRGFLVGYVPGVRAAAYPPGMAKRIPAGSTLAFQMHYTPVGSVQHDQSKLALIFAEDDSITKEVLTTSAFARKLKIPPRAENHAVTAISQPMPRTGQLLAMMPHMHLRGKSFRYETVPAEGNSDILLDIPAYDFNWQTAYRLAEPQDLAVGTRIRCVAHFDNSSDNPANPDPDRWVEWGEQTWDEMMIGYFDITVPRTTGNGAGR